MRRTQASIRTSFFDDESLKIDFSFLSPNIDHLKEIQSPPVLSNYLFCEDSTCSVLQKGTYSLYKRTIAYFSNETDECPTEVLPLSYTHAKFIVPDENNADYGFAIKKNGRTFSFYASSKEIAELWMNNLRRICILSSFHSDFQAKKVIGKGGFARVYLVESKHDKSLYAVKAFGKSELLEVNKFKAKPCLINEIDLMRSIDHENFVKLYEVHESDNSIYLVMELIKGKTLYKTIKRSFFKKNLPQSKIRPMMFSIIVSLEHLASQDIMHRDLKPANILIGTDGKVKITDFGLATHVNSHKNNYIFRKCGTPGYMAPEVFQFHDKLPFSEYDTRCDVFSIGCIFFFMLFGFPLFHSRDFDEIIRQNKCYTMDHKSIYTIKKELANNSSKIDKDALNLLLQMLEVNPRLRITPLEALSHPYFAPCIKTAGSTDGSSPKTRALQRDLASPDSTASKMEPNKSNFSFKNVSSDSGEFLFPGQDQVVEKDSLRLHIGKSESLKKAENSESSLIIPGRPHSNSLSFVLKSPMSNRRIPNKSFLGLEFGGNMTRKSNNSGSGHEERKDTYSKIIQADTDMLGFGKGTEDLEDASFGPRDENEEMNDWGEEDEDGIQAHYVGDLMRGKRPSKRTQEIRG